MEKNNTKKATVAKNTKTTAEQAERNETNMKNTEAKKAAKKAAKPAVNPAEKSALDAFKKNAAAATTEEATIRPMIAQLENLYTALNFKLYGGELPQVVITIQSDTTSCGAYGWATVQKAWYKDINFSAGMPTKEELEAATGYREINLCAEHMNRGFKAVAETLIHEMAHIYAKENGIKDTSRRGTYHNEKYRDIAEAHGLVCTKTDKYGYSETALNADMEKYCAAIAGEFHLARLPKVKKQKAKSNSIKYVCPCCGAIVRATKQVNIMCADCDQIMQAE